MRMNSGEKAERDKAGRRAFVATAAGFLDRVFRTRGNLRPLAGSSEERCIKCVRDAISASGATSTPRRHCPRHRRRLAAWAICCTVGYSTPAIASAEGVLHEISDTDPRICYTSTQKAATWERWKDDWTLHQIGQLFDRPHPTPPFSR